MDETAIFNDDVILPHLNEQCLDQPLWSIEDDSLFYPLGLMTHGSSAGKCVFVTWSADYLLNFVFKTSTATKRTNLTKVRLSVNPGDEICDVLITELNTLLLMQCGRVYYFSSVKSMHPIDWLSGVRCLALAQAGYSLISVDPQTHAISLEVYRDVLRMGKSSSTLLQRYDISFDSNLFDCAWQSERFTLLSQVVADGDEKNCSFIELLAGRQHKLRVGEEVHFFTVSGHVFALITGVSAMADTISVKSPPPDYHIRLLCSYASNVEFIRILLDQQICLIFLECGSIDIWYRSRVLNRLERQSHHTGTQYTHSHFASTTSCFYYTDEQQVAQLNFAYDTSRDVCCVTEQFKALPGIMALTWAPSLQQLVCLSSNNIFYRVNFESNEASVTPNITSAAIEVENKNTTTTAHENLTELYELTPSRIAHLQRTANSMQELSQAPQKLHAAIDDLCVEQQLIAVAGKMHMYRRLCKASLEYSMELPIHLPDDSIILNTQKNAWSDEPRNAYAFLHLNVAKNVIFQTSSLWQLSIEEIQSETNDRNTLLLPLPKDIIHAAIIVAIPLHQCRGNELLPHFHVRLITFVGNVIDSDRLLAVELPIQLDKSSESYSKLFSRTLVKRNIFGGPTVDSLLQKLCLQSAPDVSYKPPTTKSTYHQYTLALRESWTFEHIKKLFKVAISVDDTFQLYFQRPSQQLLVSVVVLTWQTITNTVLLMSQDPIAIYYLKLLLLLDSREKDLYSRTADVDIVAAHDTSTLMASLLQYQCTVERCYGTLQNLSHENNPLQQDEAAVSSAQALHLENLQRIYKCLRDCAWQFNT